MPDFFNHYAVILYIKRKTASEKNLQIFLNFLILPLTFSRSYSTLGIIDCNAALCSLTISLGEATWDLPFSPPDGPTPSPFLRASFLTPLLTLVPCPGLSLAALEGNSRLCKLASKSKSLTLDLHNYFSVPWPVELAKIYRLPCAENKPAVCYQYLFVATCQ